MNAEINALNISGTPVFWNNRCWNPLYSGTRCILKPRAFWNPLYSGTPIFWTFCILEPMYSEPSVLWKTWILETLYSGNPVFMNPCILNLLYSWTTVFWIPVFCKPCILEPLYSGRPVFWNPQYYGFVYSANLFSWTSCILEHMYIWTPCILEPPVYSGTPKWKMALYTLGLSSIIQQLVFSIQGAIFYSSIHQFYSHILCSTLNHPPLLPPV